MWLLHPAQLQQELNTFSLRTTEVVETKKKEDYQKNSPLYS